MAEHRDTWTGLYDNGYRGILLGYLAC